jgi:DNA polymerase-3 subunit delta
MGTDTKRIHLLLGPETGEKGVRLKEIRNTLRSEFGSDPEIYRFYPFETLNGEIFTALHNNSLFSEHRLVILSQAEDLQATQIKEIVEYLKEPNDSATLVIISNETYISNKISSAVPKENTKVFWEMFDNQKPQWLQNIFSREGFAITSNAVEILLELVENNTQELRSTALQLMQFLTSDGKDTVSEEDVEKYIEHTRQESVFSLFEHMATGSYERALDVLYTLIRSGDGEAVPLLAGLMWQFRRLVSLEELLELGNRWEEAVKEVKVMGKATPIRRKKDHGIYAEAVKRYPLENSRSILARIGEFDIKTRELGTDMQPMLLEQLVGIIMKRKGTPPKPLTTLSFSTDVRF